MSIVGSLMSLVANTEPWVEEAICSQTDGELFYPEKLHGAAATRAAKAICAQCPVRGENFPEPGRGGTGECLEYALRRGESHGVWGGYSVRERKSLKRDIRWSPTTHCMYGHSFAEVGRRADGSCSLCRKLQNRKYQRGVA